MPIVVEVPSPFDQTLPYFIPDPVLGRSDLIFRFVSESLDAQALGPVSEWRAGPGGPARSLIMNTAANKPVATQDGDRRVIRFDGVNDLMALASPPAMPTLTLYFVAKFSTVDAARHVISNLGGANIGIDGNKIRVAGSTGGVSSTLGVGAGEWIVFAVTHTGTTVSLSYKTETVSGAITGALASFGLGGTGGLYFGGDIHEILGYGSAHSESARTQQMDQLRDWYKAA